MSLATTTLVLSVLGTVLALQYLGFVIALPTGIATLWLLPLSLAVQPLLPAARRLVFYGALLLAAAVAFPVVTLALVVE